MHVVSKRPKRVPPNVPVSGGKRKPTSAVDVRGGRRPAAVEAPSDRTTLSWRFGAADLEGPFGWHRVDLATAIYLQNKLAAFETMTWSDLINSPHNKRIPVEHLCRKAQERLLDLRQDDISELWELRLGGKQRIWGWRVGDVLHLLWWDPDHQVCPSTLKHT